MGVSILVLFWPRLRRTRHHSRGSNRFRKKATSWPIFFGHIRGRKRASEPVRETAVSAGGH